MRKKPKTQTSPHELKLGCARNFARKSQTRRSPTSIPQRFGDRSSGDDNKVHRYFTGPQVCQRYAVSDMSIWRWLKDPTVNFPKPALVVRGRRYWAEGDLIAWERSYIPHGDDAVPPRRPAERNSAAPPT